MWLGTTNEFSNLSNMQYILLNSPFTDNWPRESVTQRYNWWGIFDQQFIFCTRAFSASKIGTHKQITFCSLKNWDLLRPYKESVNIVYFPNYENFGDMNKAYEIFIQKLTVYDKLAPLKTKQVKVNSQEWFDREVLESKALKDLSVVN